MARTFVYVSAAADGAVHAYGLDEAGGLTPLGATQAGAMVMPLAVSPDARHLYAVIRSEPTRVVTFAIDPATGTLSEQATAPLPASMPYAATDRTGRVLFTCSYAAHLVAVSAIGPDGLVTEPPRQVIPCGENAHAIVPDRSNRFVYASNLGASRVLQFRFDAETGTLAPNDPPHVSVPDGHGPRHLVVSPDGRWLYVANEFSGHVAQFAIDPVAGTLAPVTTVSALPPGADLAPGLRRDLVTVDDPPRVWAADLAGTPDGRFLYATERSGSTITCLAVDPASGTPRLVAATVTETQPRGIGIDPSGRFLVAAGERSDRLAIYQIAPQDGTLTRLGRYPVGREANWVAFASLP